MSEQAFNLNSIDRQLVLATQSGLPMVEEPYKALGEQLGLSADEVMFRLNRMINRGVIRRIALVPNHYALGYKANGMVVWNIPDHKTEHWGRLFGALPYVSHCYRRPRLLPEWPYNLFTMVHGREQDEVLQLIARMRELAGDDVHGQEVLFSKKILKKTGMRLSANSSYRQSREY